MTEDDMVSQMRQYIEHFWEKGEVQWKVNLLKIIAEG